MLKRGKVSQSFYVLLVVAFLYSVSAAALAQGPGLTVVPLPSTVESVVNADGLKGQIQPDSSGQSKAEPTRPPRKQGPSTKTLTVQTGSGEEMVSVIVKLADASLASYAGGVPGLAPTNPAVTRVGRLDPGSSASRSYLAHLGNRHSAFAAEVAKAMPSARMTHRFDLVFNGVSLIVPASQVKTLAALPGVTAVYPDKLLQLDTDRSPYFIGANQLWNQLGGQDDAGEGVIVGVLDTGIWPEHPSYADPDPLGKPYLAPPPPLSGTRQCEFSGGANPGDPFTCNNKLIGADRFMATYDAVIGLLPGEFTTARDDNGHGTHTSSTAAGNRGAAASIFDIPRGTISGIAPRAHVIMYKVCGDQGCYQSDSVAAIQKAIQDGVNVINFSIGGGNVPYNDPVELAFLDAYNAGVFVAASAGNSGPAPETVDHRGPWVMTVGASTTDRHFLSTVTLDADNGDTLQLTGATITEGIAATPVVNAADAPFNDSYCANDSPDGAFTGKVVICERGGGIGRLQKGFNVSQRGAVGMLLYNPTLQGLNTDNHWIPSVHLENDTGAALLAFFNGHTGVTATWPAGGPAQVQGDVMAPFSSRGGPEQSLGISKPDVTAPGVQILAGHTPDPATPLGGPPGELFQAIQGTSMSSPHVAGAAALLKDLHPHWTPGQIKSALMTTAKTQVVNADATPTTPFDDGSGRIDLKVAGNPGLTFDVSGSDYISHANDLWNTNYPSLYFPSLPGEITVKRTAHDVTGQHRVWKLSVESPSDLSITVPPTLVVPANGDKTFSITVSGRALAFGEVRHATITLRSGSDTLHMPVTVVRGQQVVTMVTTCTPGAFPRGSETHCTITVTNPTFTDATVEVTDTLPPSRLHLDESSVVGATPTAPNSFVFAETLPASEPPDVSIEPGDSPGGGYLPLRLFGVSPVVGVGDDTITNFNVPAFTFAGETYSQIGFSSNGYAVIGGGSGADSSINNQQFPHPQRPNNVLAPFWTDLNPATAGALRLGILTDGADTWIVLDWEAVREFSTAGNLHSFQIWIGINGDANPGEDISFAYGPNTGNGDGGLLTVGAENRFGNRGANVYFNGTGTLPSDGTQLRVTTTPGSLTSHVITFSATGIRRGDWQNCAEMTADIFQGTSISCFDGQVQ